MDLQGHQCLARYLFWFAQIVGVFTLVLLILFIGGDVIPELIRKEITITEDYGMVILFLLEVLTGIAYRISWKRKRLGPYLILLLAATISIVWGRETLNFIWFHLPILISGLLLLFYSYYKEWILKRKP